MGVNQESWIHGVAVVPEFMGNPPLGLVENGASPAFTDVNGWRNVWQGNYVILPRNGNWFHAAIPTPAVVKDMRASLRWIQILFNVADGGVLDRVMVHDGQTPIFDDQNIRVGGSHLAKDDQNFFAIFRDGITFGLNASFHFASNVDNKVGLVIASVGAGFQHDY